MADIEILHIPVRRFGRYVRQKYRENLDYDYMLAKAWCPLPPRPAPVGSGSTQEEMDSWQESMRAVTNRHGSP